MFGWLGWLVLGVVALQVLRSAMKTLDLYLTAWLDAKKRLSNVRPPSDEELQEFVPLRYHHLGPDWVFTRGKVLASSGVAREGYLHETVSVKYTRHDGIYGYYDDRGRLRLHRMKSGDDELSFFVGRPCIILYNRGSSRQHWMFEIRR